MVDEFGHLHVVEAHLDQVAEPNDTLSLHATLRLKQLTQEGIGDALDAAALVLDVLIADEVDKLETVLLLASPEVRLGDDLGDTHDPLETQLLERVVDFEEVTDLLEGGDKRLNAGLVDPLEVRLCHLLADLHVFNGHANEHVAEVRIGALTGFDHLLQDVLVGNDFLIQLVQGVLGQKNAVGDHNDDQFENGAEVGAAVSASHGDANLASLVVGTVLLKDEIAQVPDHIMHKEELDTDLVGLALGVVFLLFLLDIFTAVDH